MNPRQIREARTAANQKAAEPTPDPDVKWALEIVATPGYPLPGEVIAVVRKLAAKVLPRGPDPETRVLEWQRCQVPTCRSILVDLKPHGNGLVRLKCTTCGDLRKSVMDHPERVIRTRPGAKGRNPRKGLRRKQRALPTHDTGGKI